MQSNGERDTQVLLQYGLLPSPLNDSSPLLWQKFERKFQSEKAAGSVSKSTQFEYAWCLVRSKYNDDIRKGLALLEGEVLGWLPSSPLPNCHCPQPVLAWLTPSISSSGILFQHGTSSAVTSQLFTSKHTAIRAILSLTSTVLLACHLIDGGFARQSHSMTVPTGLW